MIGGLLLTVRRTTLLGALVSFAALSDIVALNFFYDIHVKLFSSHLLAMAVFLIIPDVRRLIDMLVLLVLAFTAYMLNFSHQIGQRPKSPLYGIWNVDDFEIDGQVRPPLVTDRERWRRVIFHYPGTMAVQLMSDSRVRYSLELDQGVMTLGKRGDTSAKWKATLFYMRPKPGLLTLEGALDGRKIRARLHWGKTSQVPSQHPWLPLDQRAGVQPVS